MEDRTKELERPGCLSVGQNSEEATPTDGSRQNSVDNDGSEDHDGTSNNVDSEDEVQYWRLGQYLTLAFLILLEWRVIIYCYEYGNVSYMVVTMVCTL